jgi:hypothetical protein
MHKKYYGCIGQVWLLKPSEKVKEKLKKRVKEFLEKWIGYPQEEFWFEFVLEGEGWQEVEYDKDLENYWEVRVEDKEGKTLKKAKGYET